MTKGKTTVTGSESFWMLKAVKYNNKLADSNAVNFFLSDATRGIGNTRITCKALQDVATGKPRLDLNYLVRPKEWNAKTGKITWTTFASDLDKAKTQADKDKITKGVFYQHETKGLWAFAGDVNKRHSISRESAIDPDWKPHDTKFTKPAFLDGMATFFYDLIQQNVGLSVKFSQKKNVSAAKAKIDFGSVARAYQVNVNELTKDARATLTKHHKEVGFDRDVACHGDPDNAYGSTGENLFEPLIQHYMLCQNKAARQIVAYDPVQQQTICDSIVKTYLKKNPNTGSVALGDFIANSYSNFIKQVNSVEETFGTLYFVVGTDGTQAIFLDSQKNTVYKNRLGVFSTIQADMISPAKLNFGGKFPFVAWAPTKRDQIKSSEFPHTIKAFKDLDKKASQQGNNDKISGSRRISYRNTIDAEKLVKGLGDLDLKINPSEGSYKAILKNSQSKKEVNVAVSKAVPVLQTRMNLIVSLNGIARVLAGQDFEGFNFGMFNAAKEKKRHYANPVFSIQYERASQFIELTLDRLFDLESSNFFHMLKDSQISQLIQAKKADREAQVKLSKEVWQSYDNALTKEGLPIGTMPNLREFNNILRAYDPSFKGGDDFPASSKLLGDSKKLSKKQYLASRLAQSLSPRIGAPVLKPALPLACNSIQKELLLKPDALTKFPHCKSYIDSLKASQATAKPSTPAAKAATSGMSGWCDGFDGLGAFGTVARPLPVATKFVRTSETQTVKPISSPEEKALVDFVKKNRPQLVQAKIAYSQIRAKTRAGKLTNADVKTVVGIAQTVSTITKAFKPLEKAVLDWRTKQLEQKLKTKKDIAEQFDKILEGNKSVDLGSFQKALDAVSKRLRDLGPKITSSEVDLLKYIELLSSDLKKIAGGIANLIAKRGKTPESCACTPKDIVVLENTFKAVKDMMSGFETKQQAVADEIKKTPITPTSPDAEKVTASQAEASPSTVPVPAQPVVVPVTEQQVTPTGEVKEVVKEMVVQPEQVAAQTATAVASETPTVVANTATTTEPAEPVVVKDAPVATPEPPPPAEVSADGKPLQVAEPPKPEVAQVVAQTASQPIPEAAVPTTDTKSIAPASAETTEAKPEAVVAPAEIQAIDALTQKAEDKTETQKAAEIKEALEDATSVNSTGEVKTTEDKKEEAAEKVDEVVQQIDEAIDAGEDLSEAPEAIIDVDQIKENFGVDDEAADNMLELLQIAQDSDDSNQ